MIVTLPEKTRSRLRSFDAFSLLCHSLDCSRFEERIPLGLRAEFYGPFFELLMLERTIFDLKARHSFSGLFIHGSKGQNHRIHSQLAAMSKGKIFAERRARPDFTAFDRVMRRKGGEPPRRTI
jgi:hypothetical protein